MTLPRRILEEGTPFERDVLASAHLDVGSSQGLKRAVVAMGLGAAAASTTTSTVAAGAAGATPSAALAGAGAGALVKWIGVGLVVVGGVAAASVKSIRHGPATTVATPHSLQSTRPPPAPIASMLSTPPPPAPIASMPSMTAAVPRPLLPVREDPTSSRASSRSVSAAPPATQAVPSPPVRDTPLEAPPTSSLFAEIAGLEQVRAALDRGDAPRALQLLDAYDRAFPSSVLTDEATVLRVDALAQRGDGAGAAALSRRFLATNPASPHVSHLRRVIEGMHNP
jgi:hypothetical protein